MLLIVTGCVGNAFQCCMLLTLSSPGMHDVQTYLCEFAHAILLDIHSTHWSCRAAAMRIQDCHQQAVAKHTHRNCQAKLPGRQESNVRLLKRRQLKSLSTLMASDKLTHRTEGLLVRDQLTARSHNNNLQRAPLLFSSHVAEQGLLAKKVCTLHINNVIKNSPLRQNQSPRHSICRTFQHDYMQTAMCPWPEPSESVCLVFVSHLY